MEDTHIHYTPYFLEKKAAIKKNLVMSIRDDISLNEGVRPEIWFPEFLPSDLPIMPYSHCPTGLAYLSRNPLLG